MKCYSRRAAAVVLVAALSFPSIAAASAPQRELDRATPEFLVRVVQKVKKILRISVNSDITVPPKPAPAPPPPTP